MQEQVFRILVVDDEETMRRSLADILRLEGYAVQTAASGFEGIQKVQHGEFDLAFLDLRMPGLDGLEVLKTFANTAPDMQVILLTAHGSLESAITALRFGACDYLLKPASPAQIISSAAKAQKQRQEIMNRRRLLDQLESSVQALRSSQTSNLPAPSDNIIQLNHQVQFNYELRELRQGDRLALLTPAENKLFRVLIENRGKLLSHRELVARVQGYETTEYEAPDIMRPLISRLRSKLAKIHDTENWITNVRGSGYIFTSDD
jgi:DNA-binding response OmpR family regulator